MTKLPGHTDSSFDADLTALNDAVREMAGLALGMVADAAILLPAPDTRQIETVVATDARLDALHETVEERAVLTIAKRQPVANDLRAIVATIRIAYTLERVGDLAKNVAKRAAQLDGAGAPREALQAARRMMLRARRPRPRHLRLREWRHRRGRAGMA